MICLFLWGWNIHLRIYGLLIVFNFFFLFDLTLLWKLLLIFRISLVRFILLRIWWGCYIPLIMIRRWSYRIVIIVSVLILSVLSVWSISFISFRWIFWVLGWIGAIWRRRRAAIRRRGRWTTWAWLWAGRTYSWVFPLTLLLLCSWFLFLRIWFIFILWWSIFLFLFMF